MTKKTIITFLLFIPIWIAGCQKKGGCPADSEILDSFYSEEEGVTGIITTDGSAYIEDNGSCYYYLQYFTPGFDSIYVFTDSGIYITTDDGDLFPVDNDFLEDFESYSDFTDMFLKNINDTALHWDAFTLQSPAAPTVDDYVDLRKCILNGTCDFIDNRIDLMSDPDNASNTVLKFFSVAPTSEMVTAKSSLEHTFSYFVKGMDIWFEARYNIQDGMPYSLADFENGYFDESPGPRVVIVDNKLAIENKFSDKVIYYPESAPELPMNSWFTVKVHLHLSDQDDGLLELWQDGNLLMSVSGKNIPLFNSIQNSLEVGVSATQTGATLLVDDVHLSDSPF